MKLHGCALTKAKLIYLSKAVFVFGIDAVIILANCSLTYAFTKIIATHVGRGKRHRRCPPQVIGKPCSPRLGDGAVDQRDLGQSHFPLQLPMLRASMPTGSVG